MTQQIWTPDGAKAGEAPKLWVPGQQIELDPQKAIMDKFLKVQAECDATTAREGVLQVEFIEAAKLGFRLMVQTGLGINEVLDLLREQTPEVDEEMLGKLGGAVLVTQKKFLHMVAGLGQAWGGYKIAWMMAFGRAENYAMACWSTARQDRWEKGGYAWRQVDAGPIPPKHVPASRRKQRQMVKRVVRGSARMRHCVKTMVGDAPREKPARCARGHAPDSREARRCALCHRLHGKKQAEA
jgi:hypothetical protein